jgi:heme-degrading monooxygenase HmoA
MYVVRDVFRCKPGQAKVLAEKFKQTIPSMEKLDGFRNCRVMVDVVAGYWTVVMEAEFESLGDFEAHMSSFGKRPEVQTALEGYMDLVDGGHRELFRIV